MAIYAPDKTLLTGEAATNEMNMYYVNVGRKLAEIFTEVWNTDTIQGLNRPPELHFRFVG